MKVEYRVTWNDGEREYVTISTRTISYGFGIVAERVYRHPRDMSREIDKIEFEREVEDHPLEPFIAELGEIGRRHSIKVELRG